MILLGGGTDYPLSHEWTTTGVTLANEVKAWNDAFQSNPRYQITEFKDFYIISVGGSISVTSDITADEASIITFPDPVNADSWVVLEQYGENRDAKLLLQGNSIILGTGTMTTGVYTHFSGTFIKAK